MRRPGLTLLELVIVLLILAALAGLVLPVAGAYVSEGRKTTTQATLDACRDGLAQYWSDNKIEIDDLIMEADRRLQVEDLFDNPGLSAYDATLRMGWNGPYIAEATGQYSSDNAKGFSSDYGAEGAPAVLDAWLHPLVIQDVDPSVLVGEIRDVRIVSAGDNGVIDLSPSTPTDAITAADLGDDLYVALRLR